MLVLSRKVGESVMIGADIEVVITRIDGNRVYVGTQAPREVKVLRSELFEKINATTINSQRHDSATLDSVRSSRKPKNANDPNVRSTGRLFDGSRLGVDQG